MRVIRHSWWVVLGGLLSCFLAFSAHAADDSVRKLGKGDTVLVGDAKCTSCHDEEGKNGPAVFSIGKTKHGTVADGRTPTCTSCHGDSAAHMKKAKDGERPAPDRVFGKKSTTSASVQNEACMSCHLGGNRMHWEGSTHASRDVACTSCHQVHTGHDKVRDKRTQSDVCFTCHKDKRMEINKASHHPIPEGKMSCSDCHQPHGSAGERQLRKDTINETCYMCHAEKRGPFIHNHQPVEENCANCHNPHGTSAPSMLKWRMPFLCQQCHGEGSHPGNVGGVRSVMPDAVSSNIGPGMAQARGCLNCHTNIHGSNNPSNATSGGAGRFFR